MSGTLTLSFGEQGAKEVLFLVDGSGAGSDFLVSFTDIENKICSDCHFEIRKDDCAEQPEVWDLLQELREHFKHLRGRVYLSEVNEPDQWMVVNGDASRIVLYFFRAPSANCDHPRSPRVLVAGEIRITRSGVFAENKKSAEKYPKGLDEFFIQLWAVLNKLTKTNKTIKIRES